MYCRLSGRAHIVVLRIKRRSSLLAGHETAVTTEACRKHEVRGLHAPCTLKGGARKGRLDKRSAINIRRVKFGLFELRIVKLLPSTRMAEGFI